MINSPAAFSMKSFSRVTSIITILVGGLVLLGWIFDIPVLKSILPGFTTMKANTAFAFILSGMALWLMLKEPVTQQRQYAIQAFAFIITLLGLHTLSEYMFGAQLGVDQLPIRDPSTAPAIFSPVRMSPATALNFLLLGPALLFLGKESTGSNLLTQVLSLMIALISS